MKDGADAFDRLEATLRGAVRAQAEPAAAPIPPRVRRPWARRRRLPRRGGLLAAAAALVVAGGGAYAATQVIDVGAPAPAPDPQTPVPTVGAGVVQGATRVLPLRVADPYGGPPWALRVFDSSRGGACVQVGQVVDGRFGRVLPGAGGRLQLRPISATPGQNSLCGGVRRRGYPVLRGLRTIELTGGQGKPITAVRTIRYGLLGPAARRATFLDADGRPGPSMRLDGEHGGAYLFVVGTDPAPYEEADRRRRVAEAQLRAAMQRLRAQGKSDADVVRLAMREVRRHTARTQSASRTELPSVWRPRDAVRATFAGGTTLLVAGHGRTSQPLPGVTRRTAAAPDVRAALTVTRDGDGRTGTYHVRFRAPIAITRADRQYTFTVAGRGGRKCTARTGVGGGWATSRDIARGEVVSFRAGPSFGGKRTTWCAARYTLRVGYHAGSGPFRGRLVGTYNFTVKG